MGESAVHIIARGRVQGVYFRASARNKGLELSLVGWVKNCSDGSVEIHAEGNKSVLDKYIIWCKQGPDAASVTSLDIDWIEPESMPTFDIRY
ncbi:MAG: acylphosphatase [Nitrospinales bacterium]